METLVLLLIVLIVIILVVVRPSNKFSPEYQRYITSDAWAKKRAEALDHYGRRCSRCGKTQYLQVHHRTYVRLGHERMSDLQVLCSRCHAERHGKMPKRKRKYNGVIPVRSRSKDANR